MILLKAILWRALKKLHNPVCRLSFGHKFRELITYPLDRISCSLWPRPCSKCPVEIVTLLKQVSLCYKTDKNPVLIARRPKKDFWSLSPRQRMFVFLSTSASDKQCTRDAIIQLAKGDDWTDVTPFLLRSNKRCAFVCLFVRSFVYDSQCRWGLTTLSLPSTETCVRFPSTYGCLLQG